MAISSASGVVCVVIFCMLVLKLMTSPERKYMLPDVDLAFSGLPVPYEASQKPMSSKLMLRL